LSSWVLAKIIRRDWEDDLEGKKNHNRKVRKGNRKGRKAQLMKAFFASLADFLCELCGKLLDSTVT
jgi:hypothetical protein